jgi:large subunit ribosomal protein L13e
LEADRGADRIYLQAAKIPRLIAPTIGIAVDHRRQNISEESFALNVERLKTYKARLVVIPKKGEKKLPKETAASISGALPFEPIAAGVKVIKSGEIPKNDRSVYTTLRLARSNQRLAGLREKRAREAAEAEASKK